MQDKLRALVKLAEIDASARHIDEQLSGIPLELEARLNAVKTLEALVGGQSGQMVEAEALLIAQVTDLKMRSDMLARSKSKSAKARNMREADAAERELDAIRRSIKDGEAEKERLEGMIEQTRTVLAEPLRELEEQKAALELAQEGTEEKLVELRAERDVMTVGREKFVEQVPKRVYRRYERIRPQIHPAVVEVINGVCQGCRISVAPQLNNQLIRADDFYQCSCQRFVYNKNALL